MKVLKKIYLPIIALSMALTGCDSPSYIDDDNAKTGKIDFSTFSIDVANNEDRVVNVVGKATGDEEDVSEYTVKMTTKEGLVAKRAKIKDLAKIEVIKVGEYTLEVENAELKNADFDAPYYYGSKNFTVEQDKVTKVGLITCRLANVKVSIEYTDELKALLGDDVVVNVRVGAYSLNYSAKETRSGFFKCESDNSTLVVSISGTIGGHKFVPIERAFDNVKAGQHRIIKFDMKDGPDIEEELGWLSTNGMLQVDATMRTIDVEKGILVDEEIVDPYDEIKTSVTMVEMGKEAAEKTIDVISPAAWSVASTLPTWLSLSKTNGEAGVSNVTIKAEENATGAERSAAVKFRSGNKTVVVTVKQSSEKPGPGPEPEPTTPTITSQTIDVDAVNTVVDGGVVVKSEVDMDIAAEEGISKFEVSISSSNSDFDLAIQELGLSTFDLCNPGSKAESLESLGLPYGSQVIGKTAMKFDISSFMSLLPAYQGTHSFTLKVTDAKNQSVTKVIRLLVK